MLHKLITATLAFMCLNMFIWYHELDRRLMLNGMLDQARFSAQNEAFGLHAKAINSQSKTLLRTNRVVYSRLGEQKK